MAAHLSGLVIQCGDVRLILWAESENVTFDSLNITIKLSFILKHV